MPGQRKRDRLVEGPREGEVRVESGRGHATSVLQSLCGEATITAYEQRKKNTMTRSRGSARLYRFLVYSLEIEEGDDVAVLRVQVYLVYTRKARPRQQICRDTSKDSKFTNSPSVQDRIAL